MIEGYPHIEISSLDEITEPNIYYFPINKNGNRFILNTGKQEIEKWVLIEWENRNQYFTVSRKFWPRQLYDFIIHGNYVRTWKTFNGAKRFIIREFGYHFEEAEAKL